MRKVSKNWRDIRNVEKENVGNVQLKQRICICMIVP